MDDLEERIKLCREFKKVHKNGAQEAVGLKPHVKE
jgi:hypothetical protein